MAVRAKFRVASITRTQYDVWDGQKNVPQEVQTIKLHPVTSGSEENKAFYASTPSGSIELSTINKAAGEQFKLNKEYYVDFTEAS